MRCRPRSDRGSATAEVAVALPALVLFLLLAIGLVNAALTRMRCVDAARDAALAQARGGDGVAAGRVRAPGDADVAVTEDGGRVHATVTVVFRVFGAHLPALVISGDAVAESEP